MNPAFSFPSFALVFAESEGADKLIWRGQIGDHPKNWSPIVVGGATYRIHPRIAPLYELDKDRFLVYVVPVVDEKGVDAGRTLIDLAAKIS